MAAPSATAMSANVQSASATANDGRDGWDHEDWGSLEEEANEELEEKATNNDMNHITASRSNSNSQSHSSTSGGVYNNNIMNNISPTKNNGDNTTINSSANSNWDNYGSSWNDDEFEPIDETGMGKLDYFSLIDLNKRLILGTTKFDEARKKREEKKLQRQRELEARRAARSGPMKLGLGAKKL